MITSSRLFDNYRLGGSEDGDVLPSSAAAFFKKQDSLDSSTAGSSSGTQQAILDPKQRFAKLMLRQTKFLEAARTVKTVHLLQSAAQLCHSSVELAQTLWISLFPRVWSTLSDRQRQTLSGELVPFLCSGAHIRQKECQPSAINTFVEGISFCDPPILLRPLVLKYVGKNHNLWHQACLMMEQVSW